MNQPSNRREIILTKEPIELFKVLKFEGIAGTGGEAKLLIADGQVSVNGQQELRKSRKMLAGDTIQVGNETLLLRLSQA